LPDYVEQRPRTHPSSDSGEVLLEIFIAKDVTGKVLPCRLLNLTGNQCAVVDADTQADLDCFADVLTVVAG